MLKHHIDLTLVRVDMVHHLAIQQNLTLRGCFKPGQHPQCRGLATARWPQERQEFPLRDCKVQVTGRQNRPKSFGDALQLCNTLSDLPELFPPPYAVWSIYGYLFPTR